jgi:hypothetical protein
MRNILPLRIVFVAMVVSASAALPLKAQSVTQPGVTSRRAFIDATVMADYDQTDFEPAGPSVAGGVGIGARLSQRYSLRFEFDIPGKHVNLDQGPRFEHRDEATTTSYAFLMGRQFRVDKKVPVIALLGVSALTHRSHFTGFFDITPRGTEPTHTEYDEHDVEQWVALTLGVEAPVAITRHLRLVPQFRIQQVANAELGRIFPSGKSTMRPRLSLRWQF